MATQTAQKAPKVRKIGDITKTLNPAFQPAIDLAKEEMQLIQPQLDADIAGAEQAKINEFRNITNIANRRGVTFSGIPIQEQARYIGEKFLPAVQQLKLGAQKERIRIRDIIAGIQRDAYLQAFDVQEGDRDKLFQFQTAEADRAFTKSERIANQDFQAAEADKERAFQASENAKNRAASARASQASYAAARVGAQEESNAIGDINALLDSQTGADGYVSPDTYNRARLNYAQFGGDAGDFDKVFVGYANPSHIQDYVDGGKYRNQSQYQSPFGY